MGVQSHHFLSQAFRVIFSIQAFRATFFSPSVQSHFLLFKHSEPSYHLRRSKPPFSLKHLKPVLNLAFRATVQVFRAIPPPHRRSEPPISFISIQSHRHSKPPSQISVQSCSFRSSESLFSQTFRVISFIGIKSHRPSESFLPQAFKVIVQLFKSFVSVLTFRATFQAFEVVFFQSSSSSIVCDMVI